MKNTQTLREKTMWDFEIVLGNPKPKLITLMKTSKEARSSRLKGGKRVLGKTVGENQESEKKNPRMSAMKKGRTGPDQGKVKKKSALRKKKKNFVWILEY